MVKLSITSVCNRLVIGYLQSRHSEQVHIGPLGSLNLRSGFVYTVSINLKSYGSFFLMIMVA
jgi:hypothetical protein